jgi:BMFP domain-containing protein YqiC
VTVPVRAGKARDDIDVLRARLSELESACDERETRRSGAPVEA